MSEMTTTPEEGIAMVPAIGEPLPEDTVITGEVLLAPAPEEATPTALDNALTIGIVAAMAIAVIIMVIRKLISQKKPAATEEAAEAVETVVAVDAPTAPGTAGEVKLNNVEPKTAAMLMAIVADKRQKPLNELRLISIKEVE